MKIKNLFILALSCISFCFIEPVHAREKIPEKIHFRGEKTLNLSESSKYSYEDAMTRFAHKQPDGYVIGSIKYLKQGRNFVVVVKLRKAS